MPWPPLLAAVLGGEHAVTSHPAQTIRTTTYYLVLSNNHKIVNSKLLICSGLVRLRIEAIAGRLCGALPAGIGRLRRLRSLQLPDCGATQARSRSCQGLWD
jgi:hypothetical protein